MASPEDGEWTIETAPQIKQGSYQRRISNLLSFIASKKDLTSLQLIQEILMSRKFAPPNIVLPSLVKYYLEE